MGLLLRLAVVIVHLKARQKDVISRIERIVIVVEPRHRLCFEILIPSSRGIPAFISFLLSTLAELGVEVGAEVTATTAKDSRLQRQVVDDRTR